MRPQQPKTDVVSFMKFGQVEELVKEMEGKSHMVLFAPKYH
jgi:hypothetical protein